MARKEFNIEDSPAMRFVTDTSAFKNFAEVQKRAAERAANGDNSIPEQPEPVTMPLEAPTTHETQNSDKSIELVLNKRSERRTKALTVKIPQSMFDEIKRHADRNDVSITEYVMQALRLVMDKIDL